MAIRSINGSSRHRPNSVVRILDRTNFTGNAQNNPLLSASSQIGLNIGEKRTNGTRNVQIFEDGDVLALKPNYDSRRHTHHTLTEHNAQQYSHRASNSKQPIATAIYSTAKHGSTHFI